MQSCPRPAGGDWGRAEIALLGASCDRIRDFARLITQFFAGRRIGYADADHGAAGEPPATALTYTDKISYHRLDLIPPMSPYQRRLLFNDCDLVLVNGNHFSARHQVLFLDGIKSLEAKLEKLTDVRLVVLAAADVVIPDYLQPLIAAAPVMQLQHEEALRRFF